MPNWLIYAGLIAFIADKYGWRWALAFVVFNWVVGLIRTYRRFHYGNKP